ncbi:MAG: polysaccharide pyruvyl transferase family protein [Haloechinothrix sp.]
MPSSDASHSADHRPLYYLVAPAGFPNYGDELIAAGWLRHLAEVAPDATVWVDTHSPGPAQVLLGELHPRVRFTETLWRLCWDAPSDDQWQIAAWVRDAVHNPGLAARWHHGIELLARADVVHLLGGGYINRIWPRHIGLIAGAVAAARRSGGRAAMTGLGLTPAGDDIAPMLRALADHFEVVDVRDNPSAELLGVAPGVDDAFLSVGSDAFISPEQAWPDQEPPEVMLCLQSDLVDVGAGRLAGTALSILRAWGVRPGQVCVVEGIPRTDRVIYALIERELPGARFYPFADVWDNGLPVSAEQTWISTRFHMHLAAASAGAGGVAISIKPDYYATKHRSLLELGSGWTLLEDFDQVPARPTSGGFGADALAAFRQSKLELAKAIYAPVSSDDGPIQRRRWGRKRG